MDFYMVELIEYVAKMKCEERDRDYIRSALLYELEQMRMREEEKDELYSMALKYNEL